MQCNCLLLTRSGHPLTFYLPSFQISAASFHSPWTLCHTTRYFPETSFGDVPLVVKLKVPISRAGEGLNRLTSRVVTFGLVTCSAMPFHIAPIAALPLTIAEPGGKAMASTVYSWATPSKSPLLNNSIHFAFTASILAF